MTNREIINQNFLSQLYQKKKEVFKTKVPSEGGDHCNLHCFLPVYVARDIKPSRLSVLGSLHKSSLALLFGREARES